MKESSVLACVASLIFGIALVLLSAKAESATLLGWHRTTGLVSIDTETAEVTLIIEALDRNIEGLAFDSTTKTLYGVEQKWGIEENVLVEINLNNGTISDIGPVGFNEVTAMTFDETTDTIFALDQTTRTLLEIEPSTGESIAIGNFSHGASNGLAAQPITGNLFAAVLVDPGYLARIDKTTGASTLVGSFGDCHVSALSFDPDTGVLFGKAGGPYGGPFANGRLVTIDLTTGLATPIGAAIGAINALAFVEETVSYSCAGFEPPCDSTDVALTVKKNKCIPLKTELIDENGYAITDADIEYPPVLVLASFAGAVVTSEIVNVDGLPPGQTTEGNQFEFIGGRWCLNLKVKDFYTAPGEYNFRMVSGDLGEYVIEPTCTVTIWVEK